MNNLDHSVLMVDDKPYKAIFFHLPDEPYGFLSNWYPAKFVLDGLTFTSSEQYIMYRKCEIFGDIDSAKAILETSDPAKQQSIGRQAKGFNATIWDGLKQLAAYRCILAKFSQNNDLRQKLLETGDAYLVECAHQDIIWACGIRIHEPERLDMKKWRGKNLLGFTLMDVRDVLKAQQPRKGHHRLGMMSSGRTTHIDIKSGFSPVFRLQSVFASNISANLL